MSRQLAEAGSLRETKMFRRSLSESQKTLLRKFGLKMKKLKKRRERAERRSRKLFAIVVALFLKSFIE